MSKSRLAIAILSDCINFSRTREYSLVIKKALDPIFERYNNVEPTFEGVEPSLKEKDIENLKKINLIDYVSELMDFKLSVFELYHKYKYIEDVKLDALKLQKLVLEVCQSYSDLEDRALYDLFQNTFKVIGNDFTEEEFASKFKEVIESIIVE